MIGLLGNVLRLFAPSSPSATVPELEGEPAGITTHGLPAQLDPYEKVVFFSSYGPKFLEVSKLLGSDRLINFFDPNLPTFEDCDITVLAARRALLLFDRLDRKPCIVEESSLVIEDTGFPGHQFRYIAKNQRYFREWVRANEGKQGIIRLAVAYCDKDGMVHSYESSQRGSIVVPTEDGWKRGIGWDPVWSPAQFGGTETLGTMLDQKHFLDVRLQLYLSLREALNPNIEGTFEIHLTVALPPELKNERGDVEEQMAVLKSVHANFRAACAAESQRPLTIFENHSQEDNTPFEGTVAPGAPGPDMGTDNCQIQFQTAIYRSFPFIKDAADYAFHLAQVFSTTHGLKVVRTRVEAMAHSKLAPKNNTEAATMPSAYYFEFHRRLGVGLLPSTIVRIKGIVERHETSFAHPHISLVGMKTFLNCRYLGVGHQESVQHWSSMEAAIVSETHIELVKKTLQEYAVLDDDPTMDDRRDSACRVCRRLFKRAVAGL